MPFFKFLFITGSYKILNIVPYAIQYVLVAYLFYFLSFCPFRVTPMAYGGSQVRGPIGAIAAAYTTAQQHQI